VLFTDDAHGRALERQFGIPLTPSLRTSNGGIPVRLMTGPVARVRAGAN
jgi:hypothetical protein